MQNYDLLILGGGPAGYNAAERAGAAGLSTVLFEGRALGGVCLNEGCIPSKALLYSAKLYDNARGSEKYGVRVTGAEIDQKTVITRKNKVVKQLVMGIGAKLKHAGVTVVKETAQIEGKTEEGFVVRAAEEQYTARFLLLATGSSAIVPDIPGLRDGVEAGFVLTNREILALTEVPQRLVVIGGGVIGLEMASYYNSVGSAVTVIEMLNSVGGALDADVSKQLQAAYAKKGVTFRLGCRVTGVTADAVQYQSADGSEESVAADKVLCAIGRRANTAGFGLETLHVALENGAVITDEYMKTNVAGLFAAGDVNGKSMLAHTAYREGEVAVNQMLGRRDVMRYDAIPSVIYTNPEAASVGETLAGAQAKGYDAYETALSMRYSGRFLAENEGGDGICKLVIDRKYNRLLGVHMLGSYTSESIYGAGMMIEMQTTLPSLRELVFPHPTVCEIIRETLFEAQ